MDLNQLYFDHQLLLMQAERAASPELRCSHRQGAALIAGRIGSMQGAMGARAAQHWSEAATLDPDCNGRRPQLPFGPPRGPTNRHGAVKGTRA